MMSKFTLFITLLFAVTYQPFSMTVPNLKEKPTLIYIGDPMCSWCYGLAPELEKVLAHFEGQLEVELIMGGLRPYNTQTMLDLKDFLTHHWEEVHQASGQNFQYGILDEATITYDTEPPSRAVLVIRKIAPEKELAFFKEIQKAFYLDNLNMHLTDSYCGICETLNIDFEQFTQYFEGEAMKKEVRADFERAAEMGVRGFPTLILQQNEQFILIANGYLPSQSVIEKIEEYLFK